MPSDTSLARRQWWGLAALAVVFTAVVYLSTPSLFDTIDWVRIHVFYKQYLSDALRAGRLPLWNPHVALGRPFLADVDAAIFYPPHFLYALLEIHTACALVTALHMFLGLVGGTKLARALGVERRVSILIAVGFLGSASLVAAYQNGLIHYGAALSYLPLVFYFGVRLQDAPSARAWAALALALGMQLMSGHPQASWVTGVGATAFLFVRRLDRPLGRTLPRALGDVALLAAAVIAAVALSAVQALPLAELTDNSNRGEPSVAFSNYLSMQPIEWASLLIPADGRFAVPSPAQVYVGIVLLFAGLAGLSALRDRNARALSAMAILGTLIASGAQTPFFKTLYWIVPGFSRMRIHARASVLVAVAIVFGAGLFFSRRLRRREAPVLGALAVVLAVTAIAALRWLGHPVGSAAERLAFIASAAILALTYAMKRDQPAPGGQIMALIVGVLLISHAALDLGVSVTRIKGLFVQEEGPDGAWMTTTQGKPVDHEAPIREVIAGGGLFGPAGVPVRVNFPFPFVRENAGMRDGWSSPNGYVSMQLARTWTALHTGLGVRAPRDQNTFLDPGLARFGPFPWKTMNLTLGFSTGTLRPVQARTPDPRAYVVEAAEVVDSWRTALDRMAAGHDIHQVALVEHAFAPALALPALAPAGAAAGAVIDRFEPETLVVKAHSEHPGLLVLAEAYYPGWIATVNGQSAQCLPVNGWMRGVPVPAGATEVVLRFKSTRFAAGAAVSAATLLALLAVLLAPRFRRAAAA